MRAFSALPCHVSTASASVPVDVLEREVDEHRRPAGERGGGAGVPVVGGHRAAERHVHVRVPVDEAGHHARAGDVDRPRRRRAAGRRRPPRSSRRSTATSARNEPSAVTTVPPAKTLSLMHGTALLECSANTAPSASTMWSTSASVSDSGGASAITLSSPAAVSTLRPTQQPALLRGRDDPGRHRALGRRARRLVGDQLDPDQQPAAAHVADQRMVAERVLQPGEQVGADRRRALDAAAPPP